MASLYGQSAATWQAYNNPTYNVNWYTLGYNSAGMLVVVSNTFTVTLNSLETNPNDPALLQASAGSSAAPNIPATSKTPQQNATQHCQQRGQLSFNVPFTNIPVTIGVSATLFGSFSSTNDIGITFPPSAGASIDITVGAPQGPNIPVQVGSGKNLSIGTFLTPSGPSGFSGSLGPSIGSPVTISPTVANACGLAAGGS